MQFLDLPWPDKNLNPNKRLHWAVLAKAKKQYRQICCAITLQAKISVCKTGEDPIFLEVLFCPPDRRHRDYDNMIASMKSGLDGVADALGVNDRRFRCDWLVSEYEFTGTVRLEFL